MDRKMAMPLYGTFIVFSLYVSQCNASEHGHAKPWVSAVSCNEQSGEILTLCANEVRLWSINGVLLAKQKYEFIATVIFNNHKGYFAAPRNMARWSCRCYWA